ncbi:Hsp70 family protein [Dyella humicola]|uniref:Hsp70 family protein n=1 Tax=Dyella humicola TaxID=2992126 RepID=UPI0022591866|nr:Hsp70 family protein [Dyella humicola]
MRIGIDLGTTTSTVSILEPDGRVRAEPPIPSLGAWRNGETVFGEKAYSALSSIDEKSFAVRDLKLSLGQRDVRIGPHIESTEKLVAQLLRTLARRVAGDHEIEEAVIGTPVNVSEEHRAALLRSAERAGFKRARLVYEPTGALVGAIDPSRMSQHSIVLVVDWGGGTLDLSIVKRTGDVLRELAVDGDVSVLGGSQMDERLLLALVNQQPKLKARLAEMPAWRDELMVDVEQYKRQILESAYPEEDEVEIWPKWLDEPLVLKGGDVVRAATDMSQLAAERILEFLYRSSVSLSQLTHVLFAGGVCQCDLIREMLRDKLPDIEVIETSAPQQLTGRGCGRLLQYGFEVQLASDFGVRQSDGTFCGILPAGHDLGLGTYRVADFMLTDALAPEAIFDFGIVSSSAERSDMMSGSAEGFLSLSTMFLRCQQSLGQLRGGSHDVVRLYSGITHSLTVTVFAQSNVGGSSDSRSITGVPLLIRLNGIDS